MSTIRDVAQKAQVSISAVSKVLNGYSDVGETTRRRVMAVVDELDYTPNTHARKLPQKTSRTLGLLIPDFSQSDGRDGILYQIMSGVNHAAAGTGWEVVAVTGDATLQARENYDRFCRDHRLAGTIIQGLRVTDPYFEQMRRSPYPTVGIQLHVTAAKLASVGIDDELAARQAVDHMVTKGYRRIGLVKGGDAAMVSRLREAGWAAGLAAHGLARGPHSVLDAGFSEQQAYDGAEAWLAANPGMDAAFCCSDLMAIGLLRRAQELGLRVPGDLGIMGFDDIILSSYVTPKLTTVRQDMDLTGQTAFRVLVDLINNPTADRQVTIAHHIVERDSL